MPCSASRRRRRCGADAEPVPVLRVRGTGHTEMWLYPRLKTLRAWPSWPTSAGFGTPYKELDTKVWQLPDVAGGGR